MINIGGKYVYTCDEERTSITDKGKDVVILRKGDKVIVKHFSLNTGYALVYIEAIDVNLVVDLDFLIPLEDFPEDHFPDTFYMQNRKLLMDLHD